MYAQLKKRLIQQSRFKIELARQGRHLRAEVCDTRPGKDGPEKAENLNARFVSEITEMISKLVEAGRTLTVTRDQYLLTVKVWLDEPDLELRQTCWAVEYLGPNQWYFGFRSDPVCELASLNWQEIRKLFGVSVRVKQAYRIKAGKVTRLRVPIVGKERKDFTKLAANQNKENLNKKGL